MTTDEAAIQRVISSYSIATSTMDHDAVMALFVPEAVWDVPHLGLVFDGHAAIRGALASLTAPMDYVLQHNAPAVIDVEGDTAMARSLIREAGKTRGQDEGFEYFGLYEDRLVRTGEGWKFVQRTFRAIGTQFHPLAPG